MPKEVLSRDFLLTLELILEWLEKSKKPAVPLQLSKRLLFEFKSHRSKNENTNKVISN